jgi:hypothetical protein
MAIERRLGTKQPSWANKESTAGIRLDSGPYIGVVKNNIDPTRSGRLQVYIPDLGGDETNVQNWRTVGYASPFFGATNQPELTKDTSYDKVHHTYGMWAVPPDIGNEVLCTFVSGDPGRGFWFACVNSHLSHGMLPAIGSVTSGELSKDTVKSELVKNSLAQKNSPTLPAAEFNENDPANIAEGYLQNKKAVHEYQAKVLIDQGLDKDPVRGAISSSSQRETPSTVFGISTPGRPLKDPADDPSYTSKLIQNEIDEDDYAIRARKGGHQFVMDDGEAATGKDQLIRLRTASGHQLLMNDSERIMYLANSDGSVWMEFTGTGHVHIYSGAGINIRTDGDFNLHADGDMNFHSKGNVRFRAEKTIALDSPSITIKATEKITSYGGRVLIGSSGDLILSADSKASVKSDGLLNLYGSKIDLNNSPGETVSDPGGLKPNSHNDTSRESDNYPWVSAEKTLSSITTIAPSHEPWPRQKGNPEGNPKKGGENINEGPAPSKTVPPIDCAGATTPVTTGTGGTTNMVTENALDPGPASAVGQPVKGALDKEWLGKPDCPNPPGGVGPLSQYQVKCLMAQIAFSESAWNYRAKNSLNYVGRYQTGAAALTDAGYIKLEYYKQYKNGAVNQAIAWTGKDGITSLDDYFNNKSVQESVMYNLLSSNYKTLVRIGGIKTSDDLCTVAGLLQVAHLLGAGGAKQWRFSGGGADANGTTGATYFNKARYAVDVLSSQGTQTA